MGSLWILAVVSENGICFHRSPFFSSKSQASYSQAHPLGIKLLQMWVKTKCGSTPRPMPSTAKNNVSLELLSLLYSRLVYILVVRWAMFCKGISEVFLVVLRSGEERRKNYSSYKNPFLWSFSYCSLYFPSYWLEKCLSICIFGVPLSRFCTAGLVPHFQNSGYSAHFPQIFLALVKILRQQENLCYTSNSKI